MRGNSMKKQIILISAATLLLTACGDKSSITQEMQYIKTSVMYDTITDMYNDPDRYLGGNYHMVGTLYPSADDDGETFYSIYAPDANNDHGIGIELDWSDYSGLKDYDRVTVEGKLDKQKGQHDGQEIEYLILRVTKLEKRAD